MNPLTRLCLLPISLVFAGCLASGPGGPHRSAPPPEGAVATTPIRPVLAPVPIAMPPAPVAVAVPPAPVAVAVAAAPVAAPPPPAVRLPAIFGNHMVLQSGRPLPIWGRSTLPGQPVTVTLFRTADGFVASQGTAVADATGRFDLRLPSVPASTESHTLRIDVEGSQPVVFEDVLLGEVWLCSGQSNMQFRLITSRDGPNAVAQANNPMIRLFTVPNTTALEPAADTVGAWSLCSPASVPSFSAVGYYFGRDLQSALPDHPPVGLIHASWGGTPAQAWTSLPALEAGGFTNYLQSYRATVAATNTSAEALAAYDTALAAQLMSVRFPDRPLTDETRAFAAPGTDDATWPQMAVPSLWEKTAGLETLNGAVWFRRELEIPADWAGRDLVLNLGTIDDCDVAFFNGQQVGATDRSVSNHWLVARSYTVPGALVTAGRAVVAVRVFDDFAGGGIYGEGQSLGPADGRAPKVALSGLWRYHVEYAVQELKAPVKPGNVPPGTPSSLFNAMINPLIPYAMRGAIWYQGESNANNAKEYEHLFPMMIMDWRARWGQGEFPFLWAQLANFMPRDAGPTDPPWARLRDAQTKTLQLPSTGQAILIDIGEANDIHPRDKATVGDRLTRAALHVAYGRDVVYRGPTLQSLSRQGEELIVGFDSVGSGLEVRGEALLGFAVAGEDGLFHWADARVDGRTVYVRCADVPVPVAVRYAWANNPAATLYNREGLPAVPFEARMP